MKTYFITFFTILALTTLAACEPANECVDGLYNSQPYSFCGNSDDSGNSDEDSPSHHDDSDSTDSGIENLIGEWCYQYTSQDEGGPAFLTLTLNKNNTYSAAKLSDNQSVLDGDSTRLSFTSGSFNSSSTTIIITTPETGRSILNPTSNQDIMKVKIQTKSYNFIRVDAASKCGEMARDLGWNLL